MNDIRFALGHKKVETTIKYLGENNERSIICIVSMGRENWFEPGMRCCIGIT